MIQPESTKAETTESVKGRKKVHHKRTLNKNPSWVYVTADKPIIHKSRDIHTHILSGQAAHSLSQTPHFSDETLLEKKTRTDSSVDNVAFIIADFFSWS